MLAIPVFRDRVAPVLNWSKRVLIISDEVSEASSGEEFFFPTETGFELLRCLSEKGVHTVICGALSRDLLCFAVELGLKILCGVSGPVCDVLNAYRGNRLEEPRFWLPGCRGQRRYRGDGPNEGWSNPQDEECHRMPRATGEGGKHRVPGRGRRGGAAFDSERKISGGCMNPDMQDFCLCPACGAEVLHQRGIPCNEMRCPECNRPMVRK